MTIEVPEGFTTPEPFTVEHGRSAPNARGVHIVWDQDGAPLYVGKADDTRDRLRQHLTARQSTLARQIGEELTAELGEYPSTEDLRRWFATRLVSWRLAEDAGALKGQVVGQLTPRLNRRFLDGIERTGIWWVNQRQSYEAERDGWLVFAGHGGPRHHRSLTMMRPGDVTIHYARKQVLAIGEVVASAAPGRRPYGPVRTRDEGNIVRVEYFSLDVGIPFEDLPGDRAGAGPFDKNGGVQQGYCFPIDLAWAEEMEAQWGWPPGSPWSGTERRYWRGVTLSGGESVGDGVVSADDCVGHVVERGEGLEFERRLGIGSAAGDAAAPITIEEWRHAVVAIPPEPIDTSGWNAFCTWAGRMLDAIDLALDERNYKLNIAAELRDAKDRLADVGDWAGALDAALGSNNNLLAWQVNGRVRQWLRDDPSAAAGVLQIIWSGDDDLSAVRLAAPALPLEVVSGAGTRTSVLSMLRMAIDPTRCPVVRPMTFSSACRMIDPAWEEPIDEGGWYTAGLELCDRLIDEPSLDLADRLDAQSLVWVMVNYDPPATWTPVDREAFLRFRSGTAGIGSGSLADLVAAFRAETGYPIEGDVKRNRERAELAAALTSEALQMPDLTALRRLAGPAYGSPGNQSAWNRHLQSDETAAKLVAWIDALANGTEPVKQRIEAALHGDGALPGVKEAMTTKVLAVTDPERWFPNYITGREVGKRRLLELLHLPPSLPGMTFAEEIVDSNDRIREALDAHFPDDPWGIQAFGWWMLKAADAPLDRGVGPVENLAQRMFFTTDFVEKVLRLVRHKPQLLFYGPPGTGKTYFALALAEHLAGEHGTVELVQFHPSYSYEDFIEGYRPRTVDGQLSYEIVDGPLKRLAALAEERPDATHVLIIDEFNRAPIAKVLGELYFLLEYRDEHEVRLQYSDTPFTLPRNLVLLATMNTSDRSIALLDAALRRRFHFVGLYPDEEPVAGLLDRFLQRHGLAGALGWLPAVVNRANQQLEDRHLHLGPSHFLREALTESDVELVWEHTVLPYVEEQFLDDPARIERFRLDKLRKAVVAAAANTAAEPTGGAETTQADEQEGRGDVDDPAAQ